MTTESAPKPKSDSLLERAAAAQAPASDRGASLLERATRAVPVEPPSGRSPAPSAQPLPPAPGAAPARVEAEAPVRGRRETVNFDRLSALGFVRPDGPSTVIAEEFRLIKRQLLVSAFARKTGGVRSGNLILVCSAMPGEGKTFCAVNLALSIAAERDLTVLLVDGDFPKPDIMRTLGLSQTGPGLLDAVEDRSIDIGDCLVRTQVPNLTILPAGRERYQTTELVASERMEDLVAEISRRYSDRIIVFDSPPALVSSTAPVLASLVGQVVFIVAAEKTQESELRQGLSLMAGAPEIRLLLNRSRFDPGRRYGNYYDYGYGARQSQRG